MYISQNSKIEESHLEKYKTKIFENGKKGVGFGQILSWSWPKPKLKDTKLLLRCINQLIGGPLTLTTVK